MFLTLLFSAKKTSKSSIVSLFIGFQKNNPHSTVTTKFEDYGVCTAFLKNFEKGKEYLIFVEGENFEVRNYCTHSEEIYSSEHPDWYKEQQNRKLKKLDRYGNFGFRFGKRFRLF